MQITGNMVIGAHDVRGAAGVFRADAPQSGDKLEPEFGVATAADVKLACELAEAASEVYRNTSPQARAQFLEAIASQILALGDNLIERAVSETALPRGRIEGERGRTVGQLRLFAAWVRQGEWIGARIDPALPQRQPLPRPDLRQQRIALGPVAVFGASNFPLAFSVAGGDTAAALAAGCPVIVKAHPAHPGTSELVGRAIQAAVRECGLPEGVFSLLFDQGYEVGVALVSDAAIQAVGFTGSRRGGLALMKLAAARPVPIPVYAEMSSINPVFLLPGALEEQAETLGREFADSLTLGVGQFCTNPGLVLALKSPALDRFRLAAAAALAEKPAGKMLSSGICAAYHHGVKALLANRRLRVLAVGALADDEETTARPIVFETRAADFLADASLEVEVFGPSSLLIECDDMAQMQQIAARLEGQLSATLRLVEHDYPAAQALLPILERRVGRILVNAYPTGVEVSHAMVHGGPFPATSDGRSTSVGTAAIERFLRPVCYQGMPQALLPPALRDANPLGIRRLHDGVPD